MARNTGGVSYKEGIVKVTKPGFARVQFPDLDGLLTDWLPLVVKKSLKDKACLTLDVGEHVACVLDEYFEAGCVLGAVYSDADRPPVQSPDKAHFSFFDGGRFEYDRASGTLTIVTTGPVNVTAEGPVTIKAPRVVIDAEQTTCTGDLKVEGSIDATGSVIDGGGNTNHHSH